MLYNEFDNVNAITDNQGFVNDIGVGEAAMGCYAGVCCEVMEEVCFMIFPVPDPPEIDPVCQCAADGATEPLIATGMCSETAESENGNTNTSIGVFGSPNVTATGEVYEFGPPTIPAGCSIVSLDITVTGAGSNNVEIVDFGNGSVFLAADGFIFSGPGTYTFSIAGAFLNAGSVIDIYVFDDFGVPQTVTDVIYTWTYSCPAAPPTYNWYGDDGNGDGVLDLTMATPLQMSTAASSNIFFPAVGDVDVNGNAFDPTVCGIYTFCATTVCGDCESDPFCEEFTIFPNTSGVVELNETVCDGDEIPMIDLAGPNGGVDGDEYMICDDAGLTTNCNTIMVTGGMAMFDATTAIGMPITPGTTTFFYSGAAEPCTDDAVNAIDDPACDCTSPSSPINITVLPPLEAGICTPQEFCQGDPTDISAGLEATCPDCPAVDCGTDPCSPNPDCLPGPDMTITDAVGQSVNQVVEYGVGSSTDAVPTPGVDIDLDPGDIVLDIPACATNIMTNWELSYTVTIITSPSWTNELCIVGPGINACPPFGTGPSGGTVTGATTGSTPGLPGLITVNVSDTYNDGGFAPDGSADITYTIVRPYGHDIRRRYSI